MVPFGLRVESCTVKFAVDSLLEEAGFELVVPL
jgi:hypothetical protein